MSLRAEILEVDQLDPVDIGHAVPTGLLSIKELKQLNLRVWVRSVIEASVSVVNSMPSNPQNRISKMQQQLQRLVDPDLALHICAVNETGSCQVVPGTKEDRNRYLEFHLTNSSKAHGLRFVISEDAAKASSYPLSFDVVIRSLRIRGSLLRRLFLGKHQDIVDAGRNLNKEKLPWASSALIGTVVSSVQTRQWKCSPRSKYSNDFENGLKRADDFDDIGNDRDDFDDFQERPRPDDRDDFENDRDDFEDDLKRAIIAFEKTVGDRWMVDFVPFNQTPSVAQPNGIAFNVEYSLCGHLMMFQITIQSSHVSSAQPILI